ncbi:MAG: patatin-like phospholipase family protein [Nocardioidaceae bacterium]
MAPTSPAADPLPGPGNTHRVGTCLCLSGGGYRAALFHLGAVRRLNELGVLGAVRTISSASGGAIVANLLADPRLTWPQEKPGTGEPVVVRDFEEYVAEPLRQLCARNIRTPALASRLLPWHWFTHDSTVRELADQMAETVSWWATPLRDNATDGPGIFTGATEVGYGVDWTFADPTAVLPHGRIGDFRIGYAEPPADLRICDAVATSCAMPPFFAPRRLDGDSIGFTGGQPGTEPDEDREQIISSIRLTDGGVYDDLALAPVWKDHATVLVSDGGSVFRAETERTWWGRMLRILGIATGGGSTVRLRWLADTIAEGDAAGSSWSLDAVAPGGYPRETVRMIDAVRTDLDAFSQGEQRVLERHGYFVADAAVRADVPDLVRLDAPLTDPQPEASDPDVATRALRDSAGRRLLGRW